MLVDQVCVILGDDLFIGLFVQIFVYVEVVLFQGCDIVDYLGVGVLYGIGIKFEVGEFGLVEICDVVNVSLWLVCVIGGVSVFDV